MVSLSSSSRYALIGPGAVGLYYGGLLAKSGAPLHVLARSDYAAMQAQGLWLRMVDSERKALSAKYSIIPEQVSQNAAEIGWVDCVLIAAKTTVNTQLIEDLRPLVEPKRTVILTLQNGMGNAEFFAKHFPENPILAGLCFVCVNRTAPAVVENYHPGRVEIGSLNDAWPELAASAVACFNQAGVVAKHASRFDEVLWRKLCWNVPFNGLSIAGGGITTDLILADALLVKRAGRLMEEIRAAALAWGHVISDRFIEGQFTVTENMGAYQPSSLIDYLANRPVEIESIWGEPLRRGLARGVAMPELIKLYQEIRSIVALRGA